jgi:hypothetical protein
VNLRREKKRREENRLIREREKEEKEYENTKEREERSRRIGREMCNEIKHLKR